tara:strand:+ start:768 stop:1016 length:249 start_codon:yes stop_codon:yes gene_type:complete
MIKIKYFAWIKDITKSEYENLNYSNLKDINELKKILVKKYPKLKKFIDEDIIRFSINQEYITENKKINLNDEIAIFPPVSGG